MAKGDVNNDGVPDIDQTPTLLRSPERISDLEAEWRKGGGRNAQSMGDGMVKIPVRDPDNNNAPLRVDTEEAKAWWEAQAVQGTEAWQKTSKTLKSLGYKTNSQMLSALNRGIDYTLNPNSGTDDPFTWIVAQEASSGGGSGSGGPYTQVQTSTNISSPSRARTAANAAFESEIGRMATKDESTQFQQALNLAEQGSPTTSVTSGVSRGRNTTSSTKTTGGFDAAAFGRDWARSQSDFAESYAAGSFMSLLDRVISQPNAIEQIVKGLE
jgi:hypothetical protein